MLGGGVWAADGAELLLLGSITRALQYEWDLSPFQRGFVVSIVFFGVLVGNFFSGSLGDKYGRRPPIIFSYLAVFVASVTSVFAWNFASLTFLRFFVGLAFGVGQPAWITYGGEIAPVKYRLLMNALGQLLFTAGEVYSAILIYIDCPHMKHLDWRWLILLGSIPSIILLFSAYFFLSESPFFLASEGRKEEAAAVLNKIARDNCRPEVSTDFQTTAKTHGDEAWYEKLCAVVGTKFLYSTIVVGYSTFCLNFVFYGGLYAFPQVLPDMDLSVSPAMNLIIGALSEIPGYVVGVIVGNHIKRKDAMQVYLFVMVISLVMFAYGARSPKQNELMLQFGFIFYKMNTSVGFIVIYVYSMEIYPTYCRNTGASLCLAAGRIGALVCPLMYEWLTDATGTYMTYIYFMMGSCALNMVLIYFLPFETKGRALPEDLESVSLLTDKAPIPN